MQKKLIIFDLDGTLVDSSEDIIWSANRTLEELGLPPREDMHIKSRIGWGVTPLLEKLLPGESAEGIVRAREVFLKHYGTHLAVSTTPYPGVMDTLEDFKVKGKLMAVVTNKPVSPSIEIIETLGLAAFFQLVLGGDSCKNKKPHPEPLLTVLERLKVKPDEAVFVGDSAVDMEAGKSAGLKTIGAAYGFRGRVELEEAGCSAVIVNFGELAGLVK